MSDHKKYNPSRQIYPNVKKAFTAMERMSVSKHENIISLYVIFIHKLDMTQRLVSSHGGTVIRMKTSFEATLPQ